MVDMARKKDPPRGARQGCAGRFGQRNPQIRSRLLDPPAAIAGPCAVASGSPRPLHLTPAPGTGTGSAYLSTCESLRGSVRAGHLGAVALRIFHAPGDVECPAPWSHKRLDDESLQDSRDCTACGVGRPRRPRAWSRSGSMLTVCALCHWCSPRSARRLRGPCVDTAVRLNARQQDRAGFLDQPRSLPPPGDAPVAMSNSASLDVLLTLGMRREALREAAIRHRFKAPTLHHVAVTAPYMLDSSSATLREIVALYAVCDHGVVDP